MKSKAEPFAFWCSRCRFDHAGECATVDVDGGKPTVGSKWREERREAGMQRWDRPNDRTWVVEGLFEGVARMISPDDQRKEIWSFERWKPEGMVSRRTSYRAVPV